MLHLTRYYTYYYLGTSLLANFWFIHDWKASLHQGGSVDNRPSGQAR